MNNNKNTLKCALFDLDGVVFDTESQYSVFWGGVFRKYYPETEGLEQKIKGQTLVQIYDGYFKDDKDKSAILLKINGKVVSYKKEKDMDVATKVSVQLQLTAPDLKSRDRVVKKSEKDSLYAAMDLGAIWLERALAGK